MGLDMIAYTVEKDGINEIQTWRKFNALHGWMEDLYYVKGGEEEVFNCIPLELTKEDIISLEKAIENNELEPREGFFWGAQEICEYDLELTREFISEAYDRLSYGDPVFYECWW